MNPIPNHDVEVIDLGLIDYKKAWDTQEELFAKTISVKLENREKEEKEQTATPNVLLLCEHPHVYTLGKTGKESNLLLDANALAEAQASFYKINRGGDITYHGPGQLVCYPIIDLENFFTDIHKFLRVMEEVIIETCSAFGLTAGRVEGLTGVWVDFEKDESKTWDPRKICAMGVKTSRWVTMHGLALNVNTDLAYFNHIVPCGIDDKKVTSLSQELRKEVSMQQVKEILLREFETKFGMEITTSEADIDKTP